MKALSIRQPWSYLICAGLKDVENRTWPTQFRGRVYVHAGLRQDYAAYSDPTYRELSEEIKSLLNFDQIWDWIAYGQERLPGLGAITGEVEIVDCITKSASPWFVGPYGFVLANPVLYEKPIPAKGRLGFWEFDNGPLPRLDLGQ